MPTTKQRRENARRRLERQIQRRQEAQAARKRRNLVTAAAFGVILVVGAVFLLVTQLGGDDNSTPAAAAPSPSASATTQPVKGECTYNKGTEAATKDVGQPPNGKVAVTGTVSVNVTTSQGDMTFSLDRSKAPCTVNSFTYLAGKKYYDNTPCHRLTTAATFGVLQCGDPGGTGSGGPGYQYGDELDANGKYTKGVLAMANAGADTNGSQFFIVYKNTDLKPNYTIFGTVTKGLDVVEKVAKGGAPNNDGKPNTPVEIKTVTLGS